jgi:hypothetical protein
MTDVCLNLLGSPELEEKLLDQLLMHPKISIFVSQAARVTVVILVILTKANRYWDGVTQY